MRDWFDRILPGDAITKIWFSRPETHYGDLAKPRKEEDIVVEGGLNLSTGQNYRFTLELRDYFCNCAWCSSEEIVVGEYDGVNVPNPTN